MKPNEAAQALIRAYFIWLARKQADERAAVQAKMKAHWIAPTNGHAPKEAEKQKAALK